MLGPYPTTFTIEDALRTMRNFDIQDGRCIVTLKPTYIYMFICIIHTTMFICAYTHIDIHIDLYLYVCLCMHIYIYIYTHVHALSKPVHTHMYIYIYICIYR